MAYERLTREQARINFGLSVAKDANYYFDIVRAMRFGKSFVDSETGKLIIESDVRRNFENLRDTAEILIGIKANVEMTPEGLKPKPKTT